ncbi:MAG: carboxymuconolactone decarboxylase family protein [Vicinamibacteria bacterium]|nr:carboxymuconolactone decarboxylase family protein [Vicinamibacteria bacterium]
MNAGTPAEAVREDARRLYGFAPNLLLEMSLSPAVARAFLAAEQALRGCSLDAAQRHAARLAVSVFDESVYGRAQHATAARAAGVDAADVTAIDQGHLPDAARFRGVVSATWQLLEARGSLADGQVRQLERQGVERPQLYEIVALIALTMLGDWIDHLAPAEVDPQFTPPLASRAMQE